MIKKIPRAVLHEGAKCDKPRTYKVKNHRAMKIFASARKNVHASVLLLFEKFFEKPVQNTRNQWIENITLESWYNAFVFAILNISMAKLIHIYIFSKFFECRPLRPPMPYFLAADLAKRSSFADVSTSSSRQPILRAFFGRDVLVRLADFHPMYRRSGTFSSCKSTCAHCLSRISGAP